MVRHTDASKNLPFGYYGHTYTFGHLDQTQLGRGFVDKGSHLVPLATLRSFKFLKILESIHAVSTEHTISTSPTTTCSLFHHL